MATNYDYYNIEIADIWQHEHEQFLVGNTSDRLAKTIIDKAEEIIIRKGEVNFTVDLGVNVPKTDKTYYLRHLNDFKRDSKSLNGRYDLNYFFNKHSCYQYEQNIIIKPESFDFDFWFALKLRQYDSKLIEISNFLNFQLESSFNNNPSEILDFLKIVTKQFKDDLLSDRVIEIVEDWIGNHSAISSVEKEVNLVDDRIILRIKYNRTKLFEVLKPYFDDKEHEKLNSLLSENEIKNKICFKSNANQFVMVFRQLHLHQQIIGKLVNTEKWICKHFTYYGKNKIHSGFNLEYVHKKLTQNFYDIPNSKRIDLPGLDYIKSK
ncbi:hypothetical protein [Gaetbulibacter jejuensis]|uniref:Uncharacterized protein n=1 Tax=Gaetbulibacter jejuensis TaxID=584607 RepID=A0ABN1JNQ1_9FLAO